MKYSLEVKTPVLRDKRLVWEWKTIAETKDKRALQRLIPKSRESDCRILDNGVVEKSCAEKNKRFSRRLVSILKEKKLLRKDLAGLCGLSRANISNYLTGSTFPSETSLKKLCDGLGVTKAELLGEGD